MNFTLNVLGTASALPTTERYPSAQVLSVHGRLFMIDCGEGAQMQMRRAGISSLKIEHICLSHIHGDHIFGLFGLLSTMGMLGRKSPLDIYAPESFAPILDFFKTHFGEGLLYDIRYVPLTMTRPEVVYFNRRMELVAFPLNHRLETFGFIFREKTSPRSYAYCSDTAPFPELSEWLKGVTLLYHEATFPDEMAEMAQRTFHSTTSQAARTAMEAGVGRLIVGHYSSRFPSVDFFLDQIREIFPNSDLVHDMDVVEIPLKR